MLDFVSASRPRDTFIASMGDEVLTMFASSALHFIISSRKTLNQAESRVLLHRIFLFKESIQITCVLFFRQMKEIKAALSITKVSSNPYNSRSASTSGRSIRGCCCCCVIACFVEYTVSSLTLVNTDERPTHVVSVVGSASTKYLMFKYLRCCV